MNKMERLAWMMVFSIVYSWAVLIEDQPLGRIVFFVGCVVTTEALIVIGNRFTYAWYRPSQ